MKLINSCKCKYWQLFTIDAEDIKKSMYTHLLELFTLNQGQKMLVLSI